MAIKNILFCLCLVSWSCTQKVLPEAILQQASKPLPYYLPPEYDLSIQEAQSWLAQHEYKREGSYVRQEQLDWNLAVNLGYFLEVPFKKTYLGPTYNHLFYSGELSKLNQSQTEWQFVIGKQNNIYVFHIRAYVPFKGSHIPHSTDEPLQLDLKRKDQVYLSLGFDSNGRFHSGVECNNKRWGHGIIDISTKKFPSTELDEIKREMYNDSLKGR
ncbi:hypothetical protein [Spirosoma validum]|uniref:Uncharacterized protein n=1 Tax=Spirosoma validum TaxID=2771355 RepID=A0A927B713_9BACT|nr:hypothetical protein [Spirosoma validum]MBD2756891.1 hypothetical protein [Spirosoma validum]